MAAAHHSYAVLEKPIHPVGSDAPEIYERGGALYTTAAVGLPGVGPGVGWGGAGTDLWATQRLSIAIPLCFTTYHCLLTENCSHSSTK